MDDSNHIYKLIELVETSTVSWEEAEKNAVETATKALRNMRATEIQELDLEDEDGRVVAYRAKVSVSFKLKDNAD